MNEQDLTYTRIYIRMREQKAFWRGWVIGAACMLLAWALS
jgi:hypothetical protein